MDDIAKNIIFNLNDTRSFNGWVGFNSPGAVEQKSGMWITKAGARYYESTGFDYDPRRQQPHFEWGAVADGEMKLEYNNASTVLKEGMYYIMPGNVPLKARCSKKAFLIWFEFTGCLCGSVIPILGGQEGGISTGRYSYRQIKPVLQIAYILQYHPVMFNLKAQSFLWQFIADTSSSISYSIQNFSPEIKHAVNYIHNTPPAHKLSITQLASESSLSVETFRKRFQADVGESPIQYLLHHRITKAKELLGDKNLTIKQIAFETGFSDPFYFSRLFKKYESVSPLTFRREIYSQTI
jgi:AraC-like DNA-binding protein